MPENPIQPSTPLAKRLQVIQTELYEIRKAIPGAWNGPNQYEKNAIWALEIQTEIARQLVRQSSL